MEDYNDDILLQLYEECDTCLISGICRMIEGQILRDTFLKYHPQIPQMQPLRCAFCGEGHKSGNCFDDFVELMEYEDFLVKDAENDECYIKKINWEQILPPKILSKESYDKDFHITDVLVEFMKNNMVSIERFESQCERLFEQVVKFEKMEEKLKIEDDFIVVVEEDKQEENTNEENKKEEINEVRVSIFVLFINVQLKTTWKQHHLFLKFMEFLPNKKKKKDDVFFLSYMPP